MKKQKTNHSKKAPQLNSTPQRLDEPSIGQVYRILAEHMPGRSQEAKGPKGQPDPFRTSISCILSAQSLDRNTAAATKALFRLARTPTTILRRTTDEIATAIKPCGLYNVKAKNIHKFCEALIANFDGHVPQTREELMSLPGIGRKCADIVLQFAFGIDTIAVDTHVNRVANRIGLTDAPTAEKTAEQLDESTPTWVRSEAHFLLIQFGKSVCRSRSPQCATCPLNALCLDYQNAKE